MSSKLDFKKSDADYYTASRRPHEIVLGPVTYLAVEGHGAPSSDAFRTAIGALYGVGYTVKFEQKGLGRDFKIGPLEAQWWAPDGRPFVETPPTDWRWRVLLRVPSSVKRVDLERSRRAAIARGADAAAARGVRLTRLREGRCVQMLHVGSYATEHAAVEAMHAFMDAEHRRAKGVHHEIYLTDPNRTAPERNRTILRQPVARKIRVVPEVGR